MTEVTQVNESNDKTKLGMVAFCDDMINGKWEFIMSGDKFNVLPTDINYIFWIGDNFFAINNTDDKYSNLYKLSNNPVGSFDLALKHEVILSSILHLNTYICSNTYANVKTNLLIGIIDYIESINVRYYRSLKRILLQQPGLNYIDRLVDVSVLCFEN